MSYRELDDNGREVKCRKPHKCEWCNESIKIGEKAAVRKYIYDGEFHSAHQHPECYKALSESDCGDGFVQGEQHRGWTLDESQEAHYCSNCEKAFKYTDEFKSSENDLCCSDSCVAELNEFLIQSV
jgi:hypothetical protein